MAPSGAQPGGSKGMVIGVVVVVVIIAVVASVIVAMVAFDEDGGDGNGNGNGGNGGPNGEKITVNIATPNVNQYTRDGEMVWDTILNIQKITPKEERVLWSEVRVVVKSNVGSVLIAMTAPTEDNPSAYDSTSPIEVEVWYVETTTGDSKMSAGDAIKITGMTTGYEGATVEFLKGGERIASVMLPTNFP